MLGIEVAILSDKGGRSYNEDACGHWNSERHLCCVLADGRARAWLTTMRSLPSTPSR